VSIAPRNPRPRRPPTGEEIEAFKVHFCIDTPGDPIEGKKGGEVTEVESEVIKDTWHLHRNIRLSNAPSILAQTRDGTVVAINPDSALLRYRWPRREEMWEATLYGSAFTSEDEEVRAKAYFSGPTVEGVFEKAPRWVVDLIRRKAPDGWPYG
jgi:hypothetical protein